MPADATLFGLSTETLFSIINYGVLPAWALLIVAPRWKGTQWVVHSIAPVIVLGLVYGALLARVFSGGAMPEGAGFGSLAGIMASFTLPEAVLAGWAHYLVFDLFVGAWEVRDASKRGMHHLIVVPCVILTLLMGPLGLLLYVILRMAMRRGGFLLDPTPG